MKPHLKAIFDERKNPTHASCRDVHDQLKPIMKMSAMIGKQIAHYRDLHIDAMLADVDNELEPKKERMRQKLTVVDQAYTAFNEAAERLAREMQNMERCLDEDEADITRFMAAKAKEDKVSS